jgi:hypothetical protein
MTHSGNLKARIERLEAQSAPADSTPWRMVAWYPDREPEPVAAEGEFLVILKAVSPPPRQEGVTKGAQS